MIKVLDHGYVRLVEAWGHGDAGTPDFDLEDLIVRDGKVSQDQLTNDFECGIVEAARQSTQGSFRGWEKDQRLLRHLFCSNPPHHTPFEFSGMVIEVQAPIFVFREWHRHRTQSYNEMSARYSPLPDLNYIPTIHRCLMTSETNKQAGTIKGAEELTLIDASVFREELDNMYQAQEEFYQKWLRRGVPKELARVDLPVGRYSRMRASTNLRNWLGFVTLRADPEAQWEIQQYANAVGSILAGQFPQTWSLYLEGR
jgi:thymidylate synthase (FAD)